MITESNKVYESPDGGRTVYARDVGSTERVLVYKDPELVFKDKWIMWGAILRAAESNPSLADAIQKVETIYALIKA